MWDLVPWPGIETETSCNSDANHLQLVRFKGKVPNKTALATDVNFRFRGHQVTRTADYEFRGSYTPLRLNNLLK